MGAIIIFEVGAARFALRRDAVARILPAPRMTRQPSAPLALAGFFAFGPDLVTVLRVHILVGAERPDEPRLYDHIVLLRTARPLIALLVDRVSDVLDADDQAMREVGPGSTHRDAIVAEIDARGMKALLIEPARLIADYEKERIRHFHDEEKRRRSSFGDAA